MKNKTAIPRNFEEYFTSFPENEQAILEELRKTIAKAAPAAEEVISYQMPAYKLHGMLVYFAAYKNHIGFYPGAGANSEFKKELSVYKGAKGSVQFPINLPLPLKLITRIVKFRVNQNVEKEKNKIKK